MARDIYVDCIHRDPAVAIDAVRRQVQVLRPGASCIVLLADNPRSIQVVADWAGENAIRASVRAHPGYWSIRLFVLPETFGALPESVVHERYKAAGQPIEEHAA